MFKGSNNHPILNICSCWSLSGDSMMFSSVKRWSLAQRVASAAQTCSLVTERQVFDIGPGGQHQLEHGHSFVSNLGRRLLLQGQSYTGRKKNPKHPLIFRSSVSPLGRASELSSKGAQTWKCMSANGCREQTSNLEDQPIEINAINHCELDLPWCYIEANPTLP